MSIRFQKRIKIFPGVTLNVYKSGFSVTIGFRGLNFTLGKKRRSINIGLPGTGISYRKSTKIDKN